MGGYTVYIDQVFLGNLVMNYIVLWAAGRLGRVYASFYRLLLAAAIGSIYSLLTFVPGLDQLFNLPFKLLFSLIMVIAAFAPLPWRVFAGCLGFFYLASFSLGGMVLGFTYLLHTNTSLINEIEQIPDVISKYFWPGCLLALFFTWLCYTAGSWLLRKRLNQKRLRVPLIISLCGKRIEIEALLDTGNSLTDPLTGEPVIVVEYTALKEALPPAVEGFFKEKNSDFNSLLDALSGTPWVTRFRVIPYQSLGLEHGLLIGVRPDSVEINQDGKKVLVNKVVVGIYYQRLHADSTYHALLHPDLLKAA